MNRVGVSYRFVSSIYSDDLLTGGVQTELVVGGGVHELYTRVQEQFQSVRLAILPAIQCHQVHSR